MRALTFIALLTLSGCGLAATGAPGTPDGGGYCLQRSGEPNACYPDEEGRSAALREQEARDQAETERSRLARQAAQAAELEDVLKAKADEARADEERHQAYLARAAERDKTEREEREARAARAAQVKLLAADPAVAGRAVSGIICTIDAEVVRLRERLGRERRATRLSGVTNLTARDSVASEIVDDEDEIKTWRASLRRLGVSQTPCSETAGIYACRLDPAKCSDADRDAGDVWRLEFEALWGSDRPHPQR